MRRDQPGNALEPSEYPLPSVGAQMLSPTASDYQTSKHAINRLCEFVNVDHGADGIKCFAIHPGGVATELGQNMPEETHAYLTDSPDLAAGFVVWLASGRADWAKGRYIHHGEQKDVRDGCTSPAPV